MWSIRACRGEEVMQTDGVAAAADLLVAIVDATAGFRVDKNTVARYMPSFSGRPRAPSQTWTTSVERTYRRSGFFELRSHRGVSHGITRSKLDDLQRAEEVLDKPKRLRPPECSRGVARIGQGRATHGDHHGHEHGLIDPVFGDQRSSAAKTAGHPRRAVAGSFVPRGAEVPCRTPGDSHREPPRARTLPNAG
jgi:hypothetical protein